MTKQTLIDPELKQVINFSNLNSLEEGLGITIMRNWSEFSIKDVHEEAASVGLLTTRQTVITSA
jgi:hypothetical protein